MTLNSRLRDAILAVCPIDGVAFDEVTREIRVDYKDEATAKERAAAQAAVDHFDWSDEAQKIYDAQSRALELAAHPAIQYALAQIKKAVPNYAIPPKEVIALDPIIAEAAKKE